MSDQSVERATEFLRSGRDYHRPHLERWLPAAGNIADVGCGTGRVAIWADRPWRPCFAVDTNVATLAAVRRLHPRTLAADALRLPLRNASLRALIGLGILELVGVERGAGEFCRVLAPAGVLYVTVPYANVRHRRTAMWRGQAVPAFTESEISEQLLAHGFEVALVRRTSLLWGLGPLRRAGSLWRALLAEDDASRAFRLLRPVLAQFANSLLVIAHKR